MPSFRVSIALMLLSAAAAAQSPSYADRFTKSTVMIAMRDGVRLNTDIYTPKDRRTPLPMIFVRTPYGIAGAAGSLGSTYKELADDGYIFVFQDIRGRYGSDGKFVMQRAPHDPVTDPHGIDETTDAWDSIDWLVKHVEGNNGRVGMMGVSYPGWLTAMALLTPHPALRAASPQASPADMFLGDDFHHNGAFRLSYGFEYAAMMETSKENENFSFDRYDTYEWYLGLGSLRSVNERYLHGKIPTWNDFVAHPNYDAFWRRQTIVNYLDKVTVPTLSVAGWWDQEDFYGPIAIYDTLEKFDTAHRNFLVVGPWNHGGWSRGEGRKLGNIDFGSATSQYYREKIQAPFFAFYLKDKGDLRQPEAIAFEGGDNRWRTFDAWPPRTGVRDSALYFGPNGLLTFEKSSALRGRQSAARLRISESGVQPDYDQYVSDPAHPVPYRNRPIQPTYDPRGSGWYTWLTEDQRFVDNRPDVLSWETAPLTSDVTIAGNVVADLFASTSGTDSDWIVKLIDVYPEVMPDPKMGGYEFMVSNEVFRGRFRRSYEKPEPLTPNEPLEYRIGLHGQSYRFQKGHRIMVQVQSTWFPIIDRNPQTFVPNIFEARPVDFRAATQRIYRSAERASHVVLPVLTEVVP